MMEVDHVYFNTFQISCKTMVSCYHKILVLRQTNYPCIRKSEAGKYRRA